MKPKNIFSLFLIVSILLLSNRSYGQTIANEKIIELNLLLNIHSYDRSKIGISPYCGILDTEIPDDYQNDEFQYDLSMVEIAEPVLESNHYSIDLYCKNNVKCIWVNRRRDVRSKDFLIKNEKAAKRIFELLKLIQADCK